MDKSIKIVVDRRQHFAPLSLIIEDKSSLIAGKEFVREHWSNVPPADILVMVPFKDCFDEEYHAAARLQQLDTWAGILQLRSSVKLIQESKPWHQHHGAVPESRWNDYVVGGFQAQFITRPDFYELGCEEFAPKFVSRTSGVFIVSRRLSTTAKVINR